ncbi:hypothetical protein HDV57DRAFT_28794 [Trichoderma longibrachiatum]
MKPRGWLVLLTSEPGVYLVPNHSHIAKRPAQASISPLLVTTAGGRGTIIATISNPKSTRTRVNQAPPFACRSALSSSPPWSQLGLMQPVDSSSCRRTRPKGQGFTLPSAYYHRQIASHNGGARASLMCVRVYSYVHTVGRSKQKSVRILSHPTKSCRIYLCTSAPPPPLSLFGTSTQGPSTTQGPTGQHASNETNQKD